MPTSFRGERLGACTDCRRFWAMHRAGKVDEQEIAEVEGNLATTAGTCAVMGTASTMASIAEALGMALPGTAAIPAVHADRLRAAEAVRAITSNVTEAFGLEGTPWDPARVLERYELLYEVGLGAEAAAGSSVMLRSGAALCAGVGAVALTAARYQAQMADAQERLATGQYVAAEASLAAAERYLEYAQYVPGASVWSLTKERGIGVSLGGGSQLTRAKRVIICTGALERPFPIPGWTLPGVMTAGAAQILLKSSGLVAAGRSVLAGCGALLWLVAAQYLRAGAKLDAVLETTAQAVREFLDDTSPNPSRLMVSFTNDDDFIFFHVPATGVAAATENEITEMVSRLQRSVQGRIETAHGEDIAALFDIYVGRAHVYYNPKIRLERMIYRGIREAANAARSIAPR